MYAYTQAVHVARNEKMADLYERTQLQLPLERKLYSEIWKPSKFGENFAGMFILFKRLKQAVDR